MLTFVAMRSWVRVHRQWIWEAFSVTFRTLIAVYLPNSTFPLDTDHQTQSSGPEDGRSAASISCCFRLTFLILSCFCDLWLTKQSEIRQIFPPVQCLTNSSLYNFAVELVKLMTSNITPPWWQKKCDSPNYNDFPDTILVFLSMGPRIIGCALYCSSIISHLVFCSVTQL